MASVLGVLERRERVALARAEELRAELERLQAAVAEAEEAARRAVIAHEETVEALAEAADEAAVSEAPTAVRTRTRMEQARQSGTPGPPNGSLTRHHRTVREALTHLLCADCGAITRTRLMRTEVRAVAISLGLEIASQESPRSCAPGPQGEGPGLSRVYPSPPSGISNVMACSFSAFSSARSRSILYFSSKTRAFSRQDSARARIPLSPVTTVTGAGAMACCR